MYLQVLESSDAQNVVITSTDGLLPDDTGNYLLLLNGHLGTNPLPGGVTVVEETGNENVLPVTPEEKEHTLSPRPDKEEQFIVGEGVDTIAFELPETFDGTIEVVNGTAEVRYTQLNNKFGSAHQFMVLIESCKNTFFKWANWIIYMD